MSQIQMQLNMLTAQVESLQKQVQILTLQSLGEGSAAAAQGPGYYMAPSYAGPMPVPVGLAAYAGHGAYGHAGHQMGHVGHHAGHQGHAGPMAYDMSSSATAAFKHFKAPKRYEPEHSPAAAKGASMHEILHRAKEFNGFSAASFAGEQSAAVASGPAAVPQPGPIVAKTMASKISSLVALEASVAPAVAPSVEPKQAPVAAPQPVAATAPAAQKDEENPVYKARRTKTRMNHVTFLDDLYSVSVDDGSGSLLVPGAILPRYIWPLDKDGQAYEG